MYDEATRIRYEIATDTPFAFGAAQKAISYIGPKGKKGLVRDIEVTITASMVGTTTVPEINVGDASSDIGSLDNEFARFRLGTAANAGIAASANPIRASSLVQTSNEPGAAANSGRQSTRFPEHVVLERAYIPADVPFFISLVPGVGGSPAGTAGPIGVEIDWF